MKSIHTWEAIDPWSIPLKGILTKATIGILYILFMNTQPVLAQSTNPIQKHHNKPKKPDIVSKIPPLIPSNIITQPVKAKPKEEWEWCYWSYCIVNITESNLVDNRYISYGKINGSLVEIRWQYSTWLTKVPANDIRYVGGR
jgi:hypothetical protein